MKKTLKFIFIICMMVLIINTISYAGYSFEEVNFDIDEINVETEENLSKHLLNNLLIKGIGFNNIYVPYLLLMIYIIIEIILIKKYKRIKQCMLINLAIILLIIIANTIIGNFIINIGNEVEYITSTMYITNSFIIERIVNIVINSLILIIGLIYQIKIIKKYDEEQFKKTYKRIKAIILLQIIIITILFILINIGPKMHVVEADWGFGHTINKRKYNIKIFEGKNIGDTKFKVLKIDDEGILIEYTRGYYEADNAFNGILAIFNTKYKTETVQQKMIWNINYVYHEEKDPMLCVDGGTHYYVRFEK